MIRIAVTASTPELNARAEALAEQLKLPFSNDAEFLLIFTPLFLGLQKKDSDFQPLYVDFLSREMTRRRQQATVRKESLARALGLKNKTQPSIVDATAGLARDSFILACLGFEVTLLERSPIVAALLQDGLQRAALDETVAPIVSRLHLEQIEGVFWLKNAERPDLIYLDPMFPERKKSALVKKDMQIFQEIMHEEDDSELLLKTALECAKQRVVVKRPRLAEPITGPKPSFCLSGSSSRFDVYMTSA
jgi:16S rRNA (guanine1516-N2)-methyltransferase